MAALVIVCAAGGCSRPCVDGEHTSNTGAWGFGTVRSGYEPCPQKSCTPGWTHGCACRRRAPCVEHYLR